ncbi:transmembrane protease serine 11A-like, partial [Anoplophora glabripennis]|uniref:transmembrane protease serine 11A-like n=1 Tax=Anoplophora glabripennis TaxID=217634 RepID=UPI000C7804CB
QDGGSPLSCPSSTGQYSVAGLVIWGKNCGQTGVYGVYVNVPYYYTWIQSILSQSVQDGGSPLSCPSSTGQYSVAGLVIWGKNCGQTGVYGVYVNVPYYYTWIQSILSQSVVTTA